MNYCHKNWSIFCHLKTHQFLQITKIVTYIGENFGENSIENECGLLPRFNNDTSMKLFLQKMCLVPHLRWGTDGGHLQRIELTAAVLQFPTAFLHCFFLDKDSFL